MRKTSKRNFYLIFGFLSLGIILPLLSFQAKKGDFASLEMAWREKRDKAMRAPTSWLTIAGLFWLDEGENSFGQSVSNKIRLPKGSCPDSAGKFILSNGIIRARASGTSELRWAGKTILDMLLKSDETGKPDIIELNDLRMWVIKRGNRYAIRLRDLNHPPYKTYSGLDYFPPSENYRVEAKFIPHPEPKKIQVQTMIDTEVEMISPGYVTFTLDNKVFTLVAFQEDPANKNLFFIFKDETNGIETYEACRFMTCSFLEDGKVDLNFNRAHNPPCAYTPFATCPLPPPENYLKIRIDAGEKKYPGRIH